MTDNKLNYSNNLLTALCLCPLCREYQKNKDVNNWPAKGKENINTLKDLNDMLKELSK